MSRRDRDFEQCTVQNILTLEKSSRCQLLSKLLDQVNLQSLFKRFRLAHKHTYIYSGMGNMYLYIRCSMCINCFS